MPLIAANIFDTFWEMPVEFWLKIFVVIVVLLLLSVVFKKVMQLSQFIFAIALILVAGVICTKWVQDRSEPAFMSPIVDFVASFFPRSAPKVLPPPASLTPPTQLTPTATTPPASAPATLTTSTTAPAAQPQNPPPPAAATLPPPTVTFPDMSPSKPAPAPAPAASKGVPKK